MANPNEGHRAGAAHISNLLEWCQTTGISMVTLWLLSTDNLRRADYELQPLLAIIADVVDELAAPGAPWKLRIVGAMDVLPDWLATRLAAAEMRTQSRNGVEVNIAVGYGGRQEIIDAVKSILQTGAEAGRSLADMISNLDTDLVSDHLYTSGQPDPDLIIRTSGEQRSFGLPALAERSFGVLVLRGRLAGFPAGRLPAGPARLRRPTPPLRELTGRSWTPHRT